MELTSQNRSYIRFNLPDGDGWVDIRPRPSVSFVQEQKRLLFEGFAGAMGLLTAPGEVTPDQVAASGLNFAPIHEHQVQTLVHGIRAWSLGGPETVTREAIEDLDEPSFAAIYEFVDALWKERSPDQKNGSSATTPRPSTTVRTRPKSSRG